MRRGEGGLAAKTYTALKRKLAQLGFKAPFVREAILPDWWRPPCERDVSLLPEVEIRIARFLGVSIQSLWQRDPIPVPQYARAQLRHVRTVERERLVPAIHAATKIAAAAIRCLRKPGAAQLPPADPHAWREALLGVSARADLPTLVEDLWTRGVPVLQIDVLPAPKFRGMACIVDGRPAILIGHHIQAPAKLAFDVAHEVGHLSHGDCDDDAPVVDETDDPDSSPLETSADQYASNVLGGAGYIDRLAAQTPEDLALSAYAVETEQGVDAGHLIMTWARTHGDYARATQALKALYRDSHGHRTLRKAAEKYLDIEAASESDRALLRCLATDMERRAPVD